MGECADMLLDGTFDGFTGGDFLAAKNPAWLADTFVWGKGYYIKYTSKGKVEEVANMNISERTPFKLQGVRPASDIEILAIRQAISDKYNEEI